MGLLLEAVFEIFLYMGESSLVSKRTIARKLRLLEEKAWFQRLMEEPTYAELVANDRQVRRIIGACSIRKLKKPAYIDRYSYRLETVLEKRAEAKRYQ
ncbi:hypothetical protein DX933_14070 [Ornithinibacillus gellani]|uniref:hypothetical protein n=1 Tax=Ornithinibacillus gellani TaxID=2293253 RepID=UPI000F4907E3|nr:hypothetical protein [Ornithinibacillus gellani]TQS72106.1 hypothetical protein DX933_14070 [Ornithinibacillus gellani]